MTVGIDPARLSAARAGFAHRGESVSGWAKRHGFPRYLVHDVLNGRLQALRGKSHNVAVLLGLKDGEIANPVSAPSDRASTEDTVSAGARSVMCDRAAISQTAGEP